MDSEDVKNTFEVYAEIIQADITGSDMGDSLRKLQQLAELPTIQAAFSLYYENKEYWMGQISGRQSEFQ